jgi:diguanylate cyclase (GGDEF)-like protein
MSEPGTPEELEPHVYSAAAEANKRFGGSEKGRKLLADRELGTEILDMAEEKALESKEKKDLQEAQAPLEHQARVDQMTQLKRKEELAKFLTDKLGSKERATMLFFDIDFFRDVNNTHGHIVGDEVLKVLGQRLLHEFPEEANNFLARYGGEEFVVIMVGVSDNSIGYRRAEAFRKKMEENPIDIINPTTGERLVLNKTVSIGVADRRSDRSNEQWINDADQSMYLSKQAGRNKVTTSDELQLETKENV